MTRDLLNELRDFKKDTNRKMEELTKTQQIIIDNSKKNDSFFVNNLDETIETNYSKSGYSSEKFGVLDQALQDRLVSQVSESVVSE